MPTPIALLVDDSCPLVHVYRRHWEDVHHRAPVTDDGRPLLDDIPNSFLDRYCDVVERRGIRGKFSIVPAPAGRGDIVHGIDGYGVTETREWLDTAKRRLSQAFDFTPEGITHNLAVNLQDGGYYDLGESDWSQTQSRATLYPYLVRQLSLLREAGFDATGVTSPWVFGIQVEEEYTAAIAAAQKEVYGREFSWYFLHMLDGQPESRPRVALREGTTTLVSIPSTTSDVFWRTINSPRTDPEFISSVADLLLTPDGRSGAIRTVLDAGGWPVLLTHWQSLFSNGTEAGLAVLDEVGRRVEHNLKGHVEWVTCLEMARRAAESTT
ncbi:MAG: hypothetical protein LC772_00135 [Chloroflexi bacterium]|nr:hypothetical protein [Chloroflexota bacterium]